MLFNALVGMMSLRLAAALVGLLNFALAALALTSLEETYGKNLDYQKDI